jgi:acetoin utilization deacetylase AcuC-like enzyme
MLKVAWSQSYVLPLPAHHRFPMSKYEALPAQLLHEGTLSEDNLFMPRRISDELIIRTHEAAYWTRLKTLTLSPREVRRTGFPLTRQLIEREATIINGTVLCTQFALTHGISMNIAGGTHHAFSNRGEGFCLLNDIAIAAHYLLDNALAKQILVVDLDVHQGNGTARIFSRDTRVFTFSMHGKNNFPLAKERSDLDVGLADHTDDSFYLRELGVHLNHLLDMVQPDFMFFQSGVDVLATDRLGRLSLSREGCKLRDKIVLETAKKNNVPLVVSMGGGYSENFRDIIEAHANTYRLAQDIFF